MDFNVFHGFVAAKGRQLRVVLRRGSPIAIAAASSAGRGLRRPPPLPSPRGRGGTPARPVAPSFSVTVTRRTWAFSSSTRWTSSSLLLRMMATMSATRSTSPI